MHPWDLTGRISFSHLLSSSHSFSFSSPPVSLLTVPPTFFSSSLSHHLSPPPSLWLQLYFSSGDSSRKRASGLENTLPSRLLPIQPSLPEASPEANKVTENTLISLSSFSHSSSFLPVPSHPAASAGQETQWLCRNQTVNPILFKQKKSRGTAPTP